MKIPIITCRAILYGALVVAMPSVLAAAPQKHDLPDGKGYYYVVLPKDHDPKKSYDLVIALHGAGDTAENFAKCWESWMGPRDTILAMPEAGAKAGPGFTWQDTDDPKVPATLDDCVKNFGADRKRVMLMGHSAGCAIGFLFLSKHPDMFTCYSGTAMVVEPFVKQKDLEKAVASTAIYYAVGKQDPNHKFYKDTVELLTKLKFNLVTEDPDIGHTVTPEEVKKMLEVFDSTADKAGQERLTDAKKQLAAKNWAAAETALIGAASGRGASATEAKALLDNLKKDFATKMDAAKALKGPDELDALTRIEREYPGTSAASEAHSLSEQVSKDPETQKMADVRKHEALESKATQAMTEAQALEKSGKLQQALDVYTRIVKDFADSTQKVKAVESAERLKKDPKLTAAKNTGEADKLLKRADNFLRNGANDEAKDILAEIVEKYPDTDAAKQAKSKAAELK